MNGEQIRDKEFTELFFKFIGFWHRLTCYKFKNSNKQQQKIISKNSSKWKHLYSSKIKTITIKQAILYSSIFYILIIMRVEKQTRCNHVNMPKSKSRANQKHVLFYHDLQNEENKLLLLVMTEWDWTGLSTTRTRKLAKIRETFFKR